MRWLDRCPLPECPGIGWQSDRAAGRAAVTAPARVPDFETRAGALQGRRDLLRRDASERDLGPPVPRRSGLARPDPCVNIDKPTGGWALRKRAEEGRMAIGLGWSHADGEVEGHLVRGVNRGVHQTRWARLQAQPHAGQGADDSDAEGQLGLRGTGHRQYDLGSGLTAPHKLQAEARIDKLTPAGQDVWP